MLGIYLLVQPPPGAADTAEAGDDNSPPKNPPAGTCASDRLHCRLHCRLPLGALVRAHAPSSSTPVELPVGAVTDGVPPPSDAIGCERSGCLAIRGGSTWVLSDT
eukprot:265143-Pyramimonas_sp.AAC.2